MHPRAGLPRSIGHACEQDGDVVVGLSGHERAHEGVRQLLDGSGGTTQLLQETVDPGAHVVIATFDQAVGVQGDRGSERQVHLSLAELQGPGAERRCVLAGQAKGRLARSDEQRGQVPGVGVSEGPIGGVVDGVDAGHDLVLPEIADHSVEELEHVGGGQVQPGVGPDSGAQLAHDGGGPDPAAHDVTHDVTHDERGAARRPAR